MPKLVYLHGAASYVCQNKEGQIHETESISAGLDYPGVSPIHCFSERILKEQDIRLQLMKKRLSAYVISY